MPKRQATKPKVDAKDPKRSRGDQTSDHVKVLPVTLNEEASQPAEYRSQKTQDPLHPIPESLQTGYPSKTSKSVTSDRHRQAQPIRCFENSSRVKEGDPTVEEDPITAVFGSIINPSSGSIRRPDRSKLNLEGLQKNRPRSFEGKLPTGSGRHGDRGASARWSNLSPTVETDGLDFADAVLKPSSSAFHEETSNETFFVNVSDVAGRLAAIGDRIVVEKESESEMSASEVKCHLPGSRRQSSFERSDIINRGNVSITAYIIPVVKSVVTAQNYDTFKQIVQRELSNTIGWKQVAWFTYLMKTAVHIAEAGEKLVVNTNAKKYFSSKLKPFIESRPNGWDSIHEETDVDI